MRSPRELHHRPDPGFSHRFASDLARQKKSQVSGPTVKEPIAEVVRDPKVKSLAR
jgi:hypothetical protein